MTRAPYEPDAATRELLVMLMYRRPYGSAAEQAFVDRFVAPLGTTPDAFGNHWLTIGKSPILWSSHTDTVHSQGGPQRITLGDGTVCAPKGSNCLGADCTTGVWLMRHMILARIPGTYIFHRGEEVGGLGSAWIAEHSPGLLAGLQFAIAFDRKGYDEVITHQAMDRTASDEFAQSLSAVLAPLPYKPSAKGVFTDTAVYEHLIPECTNISVGYFNQHTKSEYQDVRFAAALLDRLISADWSRLTCSRDPVTADRFGEPTWSRSAPSLAQTSAYVRKNWADVADFLHDMGFTPDDIDTHIWNTYGPSR